MSSSRGASSLAAGSSSRGTSSSNPSSSRAGGGSSSGGTPAGNVTPDIRVNHFGYRLADTKVAVLLGHAGSTVELRRDGDNSVAATFTASSLQTDGDSGDAVSTVDFSSATAAGDYHLYLPGEGTRSDSFRLANDVYAIVGAAAVKSFFYQRCNQDRALPYASDALGGFSGVGGRWVDGLCHAGDTTLGAGPGSANHGALDLHGGWHDAGDYQKTLWARGVPEMLFAYEINPAAWADGQLNIPESGNGTPDILDEVRWELDFYVRMQRPDGHFMTSAKGRDSTVNSPPSASDEMRVYFDTTSPNGNGWSGGGVTVVTSTANAVLSLAHAAVVFEAAGLGPLATTYRTAALNGWTWLHAASPADAQERRQRLAAACAVFRLDNTVVTARDVADAFAWSNWDGMLAGSVTPAENTISTGAWHYLLNAGGTPGVKATIRTAVAAALVERAFDEAGVYGGMFGGPGNGWDWSWGSNRAQSSYGANLMLAAHFDIVGSHTRAAVEELGQRHFHYLLGLNPLNMVYLTNMAAYGGEHSSFQIYHAWFSYTAGDGDNGNADYNGRPTSVTEPLYPYHPDDTQTSRYGPAPGLVPGGPNFYYSAAYDIPNKANPAYAYRDFSVGCDWNGSSCLASSWEITEPMNAYQGPMVLLASFFMAP